MGHWQLRELPTKTRNVRPEMLRNGALVTSQDVFVLLYSSHGCTEPRSGRVDRLTVDRVEAVIVDH